MATFATHPLLVSAQDCYSVRCQMSHCSCFSLGVSILILPIRVAQLVAAWQLGSEKMEREWENEEEMEREWGNGEEMEREWGNGERFTLYISSFSLYFLPLYSFPMSKNVSFCRKMLNTALLSLRSKETYHTRCEKIILSRIRCDKAPQVVRAWCHWWAVPVQDVDDYEDNADDTIECWEPGGGQF